MKLECIVIIFHCFFWNGFVHVQSTKYGSSEDTSIEREFFFSDQNPEADSEDEITKDKTTATSTKTVTVDPNGTTYNSIKVPVILVIGGILAIGLMIFAVKKCGLENVIACACGEWNR